MNELRGERETALRNAVMKALLHFNSSNFGMALQALHDAINVFDNTVKADFLKADQDAQQNRKLAEIAEQARRNLEQMRKRKPKPKRRGKR
jgi:hypothetical protein